MRDELVRLGVADNSKFEVIPLGFDLSAFSVSAPVRREMREALLSRAGHRYHARVVTLIARLVPIKRVDCFLYIASGLCDPPDIRFLVVGDGELREQSPAVGGGAGARRAPSLGRLPPRHARGLLRERYRRPTP